MCQTGAPQCLVSSLPSSQFLLGELWQSALLSSHITKGMRDACVQAPPIGQSAGVCAPLWQSPPSLPSLLGRGVLPRADRKSQPASFCAPPPRARLLPPPHFVDSVGPETAVFPWECYHTHETETPTQLLLLLPASLGPNPVRLACRLPSSSDSSFRSRIIFAGCSRSLAPPQVAAVQFAPCCAAEQEDRAQSSLSGAGTSLPTAAGSLLAGFANLIPAAGEGQRAGVGCGGGEPLASAVGARVCVRACML